MTLLWAVPVVAASIALTVLVTQARKLEELSLGLAEAIRRLRELRRPLRRIRQELNAGDPLADRLWRHWQDDHPS